jgi:hypothetical protein
MTADGVPMTARETDAQQRRNRRGGVKSDGYAIN